MKQEPIEVVPESVARIADAMDRRAIIIKSRQCGFRWASQIASAKPAKKAKGEKQQ